MKDKYWLVTTQRTTPGCTQPAVYNMVTKEHPSVLLYRLMTDGPFADIRYRLLFAMEISEEQFTLLSGVDG